MRIRLVLVDDHPVVREGLRAMLSTEPDLDVVADCALAEDALRAVAEFEPDVVLMDLRLPGMDGVEATARITAHSAARVLVLTTFDSDTDILRAVESGATGYLLKDAPRTDLVHAIRAAARGE
ncbi:MAG: response regulator transcription factor, partial [Actinomycetia bacterium]|nr:response regulator transcription factor [Actinomycetes bacterium]